MTMTFEARYSIIPAVIVVRKEGTQTRITPVPLSWPLLLSLLGRWLAGLVVRIRGWGWTGWIELRRTLRSCRARVAVTGLGVSAKIIVGRLVGMSWPRSVVWGLLSV